MNKFFVTLLTSLLIICFTNSESCAIIYHRDVSYTPIRSVYKCQIRKERCTVYKLSYFQRNRAYYSSQCTGSSFEQTKNSNTAETDVRRGRYVYCSPVLE